MLYGHHRAASQSGTGSGDVIGLEVEQQVFLQLLVPLLWMESQGRLISPWGLRFWFPQAVVDGFVEMHSSRYEILGFSEQRIKIHHTEICVSLNPTDCAN